MFSKLYNQGWKFGQMRNAVGRQAVCPELNMSIYITWQKEKEHVFYYFRRHCENTGSGRVLLGSRIWPKYSAGIWKMINILMGSGIWLLSRKWDSPKFGHGMWDFFRLSVGNVLGNRHDSNKRSSGQSESTRQVLRLVSPNSFQTKL